MSESVKKGSTGKFQRQGHTAGKYGNEPGVKTKRGAKELKP